MGWVKRNKLSVILIIILIVFLVQQKRGGLFTERKNYEQSPFFSEEQAGVDTSSTQSFAPGSIPSLPIQDAAPVNSPNRLVVHNSSLSLVVKDVRSSLDQIISSAQSLGGYMVDSSLSSPQEAASATVTVRVPQKSFDSALQIFRELALRVVSENLQGEDVTDEYVDIEKRLATFEKTKIKFEQILDQAARVPEILEVQRELINLQSKIDSLKGQMQYFEQNARLARITVYLSTDEFSLPYGPSDTWRPNVIFKSAVRSLVTTFRKVGTALIWVAVYSPIWISILIIFILWRKKRRTIA